MNTRGIALVAVSAAAPIWVTSCSGVSYSQEERSDAVYECKHNPESDELYYECLQRLLPDLTEDELNDVIDDGNNQRP